MESFVRGFRGNGWCDAVRRGEAAQQKREQPCACVNVHGLTFPAFCHDEWLQIFAPAPATTRGQATVITADEKTGKLLYGSGRSVVIRSIADPLKAELFTEHSKDVTVARVSFPLPATCLPCCARPPTREWQSSAASGTPRQS